MDQDTFIKIILIGWLLVCAIQDWREGEVSNWLTVPALILAATYALWRGGENLSWFAVALVGFSALLYLDVVGGADVKILASLAGIWPMAFLGALFAQGLWGVVVLTQKGRGSAFRAVPTYLLGAVIISLIY
jgi:prepilin peptidase CpaA